MAKYLMHGQYSIEGMKKVIQQGGTGRRSVAEQNVKSAGGVLESMYFGFENNDFYLIADLPDHAAVTALTMAVSAMGDLSIKATALMTPEEVDEAARMHLHPIQQPRAQ